MRLANQEFKGGFRTENLYYQSVQWIMKDEFGHARLTREITDAWTARRFEHGGHRFNVEAPELSQEEIDSIPGARASLGNLDSFKFEILERIGDRMMIKGDEHKYLGSNQPFQHRFCIFALPFQVASFVAFSTVSTVEECRQWIII